DAAVRAAGRRNPPAHRELAQGPAGARRDRRGGDGGRRSLRRGARALAPRPQPHRRGTPAAPLHAGAASRLASPQGDRRVTRRRYVMATATAASAFAAAFVAIAVADPFPRVIWNASASAPIGLYRIHPDRDPAIGVLVAVTPPKRLSRWLSARGYLPEGVPLLKHVAAKAGQRVCR